MKTAVVYSSKKGFVKEAAERIQSGLGEQADLFDLSGGKPGNLENYDAVIFAVSVRAGRFPGRFNRFCEKQVPRLKNQKVSLLVSGLDEKTYNEAVDRNLPVEVKGCFQKILYIGGRYLPEQYGRFIRMLMTRINENDGPVLNEKMDAVDALIEELNAQ